MSGEYADRQNIEPMLANFSTKTKKNSDPKSPS
jgi:hypothetical protein